MQTYESYKNSGIDWLGEVPSHWETRKLGNLLKPYSVKNMAHLPLLSITREKGVIVRGQDEEDENHNFIPDDLSGYKHLKKGQFGMNKMKAWQGSYGYSNYEGIVSPAYFIFDIDSKLYGEFFSKTIRSKAYIPFFIQASDGVRIGQWDLSKARMKEIPFFVPPISEQEAIAAFLDEKCRKIDELVSVKEQQIALLKERRQVVIHEAVTKGIQPNVELKPSGIDWIGEIPSHWEVVPGFTLFKENKRKNKGMIESTVLSLSYGNIIIKPIEKLVGLVPESFETYQIVQPNDIIIRCTDLQNDQKSLRIGLASYRGIITSAYLNLKVLHGNPNYFFNFFYTLDITKKIYKLGTGLRQNLSFNDFKKLEIIVPPISEQEAIVAYLEEQTGKIDQAIALKTQQIEKLKAYKQSLINEVVTGKVKVA